MCFRRERSLRSSSHAMARWRLALELVLVLDLELALEVAVLPLGEAGRLILGPCPCEGW